MNPNFFVQNLYLCIVRNVIYWKQKLYYCKLLKKKLFIKSRKLLVQNLGLESKF